MASRLAFSGRTSGGRGSDTSDLGGKNSCESAARYGSGVGRAHQDTLREVTVTVATGIHKRVRKDMMDSKDSMTDATLVGGVIRVDTDLAGVDEQVGLRPHLYRSDGLVV